LEKAERKAMPFEMTQERKLEIASRLAQELHVGLGDDLNKATKREVEKAGSSWRPRNASLRVKQAGNLWAWLQELSGGVGVETKEIAEEELEKIYENKP
jgi:hypothetical protein